MVERLSDTEIAEIVSRQRAIAESMTEEEALSLLLDGYAAAAPADRPMLKLAILAMLQLRAAGS